MGRCGPQGENSGYWRQGGDCRPIIYSSCRPAAGESLQVSKTSNRLFSSLLTIAHLTDSSHLQLPGAWSLVMMGITNCSAGAGLGWAGLGLTHTFLQTIVPERGLTCDRLPPSARMRCSVKQSRALKVSTSRKIGSCFRIPIFSDISLAGPKRSGQMRR